MQISISAVVLLVCLQVLLVNGAPDWISPEMMEMVKADKGRCMAAHGTTEALIDEVNAGHLPNDRAITCYMFCLFESFSLVDEDGQLEVEMLIGFLPDNLKGVAGELLSTCASYKGSDECDTMYGIAKCVQEKRPDLWFMV